MRMVEVSQSKTDLRHGVIEGRDLAVETNPREMCRL